MNRRISLDGARFAFAVAIATSVAHAQETTPHSSVTPAPAAASTPSPPATDSTASAATQGTGALAPALPGPAYPAPAPSYLPPPGFFQRDILFDATAAEAELQVEQGRAWRTVCNRACRTPGIVGAKYRVSGDGVTTSKSFIVHPSPNPVVVHADAGSSANRGTAVVLMSIGGATMIVGIVVVALGSVCALCSGAEKSDRRRDAAVVGTPVIVVGAGALAGGLVMLFANRTRLDFAPGAAASVPRVKLGRALELTTDGLRF